MPKRTRRILVLVGCAAIPLLLCLAGFRPLLNTEWYLRDLLAVTGRKAAPDPRLVYLSIDPASIQLDQLFPDEIDASPALRKMREGWQWPRDVYAHILDRLVEAGARMVVFDLLFPTEARGDAAFRRALDRHAGKVAIGSSYVIVNNASGHGASLSEPAPSLIPAGSDTDSRVAVMNFVPDTDGTVRRANYFLRFEDVAGFTHQDDTTRRASPSAIVLRQLGLADRIPAGNSGKLIRFAGPPGTFAPQSVFEIFVPALWEANYDSGAYFKDKIVVVGPDATLFHDAHPTPFLGSGQSRMMPGPELHLQALNAALTGQFLADSTPATATLLALLALVAASILCLGTERPVLRFGALLLFVLGHLFLVRWAFNSLGVFLPVLLPLLILSLGVITGTMFDYVHERLERKRMRSTLERYVSPDIVKEILENPLSFLNSLGGERKKATMLFCDLRGFTDLMESQNSSGVLKQLNEYFEAMVECILKHGGTVDKIMGDALMAVWGSIHTAGEAQDAVHAVRAAMAMAKRLAELNLDWTSRGLPPFRMGVGINHGTVISGNVGSSSKMDPTVIGDAVNVAARLEKMTKETQVNILIGESAAALVEPSIPLRHVTRTAVRGRQGQMDVYSLAESSVLMQVAA